jgi:hypothetical protein
MSERVERLEALLQRVQRNRTVRGEARAGAGLPVSPARAVAAAGPRPRLEPSAAAAPASPPQAAPARPKPAPTPLEMAFEARVSRPAEAPRPVLRSSGVPTLALGSEPPTAVRPAPQDGRVLVEPGAPEPTKPIVQVVSKQPPIVPSTFGELLRRSLSLRPR